jgi:hypothetical protein
MSEAERLFIFDALSVLMYAAAGAVWAASSLVLRADVLHAPFQFFRGRASFITLPSKSKCTYILKVHKGPSANAEGVSE